MATPSDASNALILASETQVPALPDIVQRAGQAAVFAAEEFYYGSIRNEHTRTAYRRAVDRFLAWCENRGLELARIAPKDVGQYFDGLRKQGLSVATCKQHLAAVRHFFDGMVTRHAVLLNPALSVRGERYEVVDGKTPEISVKQARLLLKSMDASAAVSKRDRAILAILAYTSSRAGAVSKLRRGDFYDAGDHQWMLRFAEKGGNGKAVGAGAFQRLDVLFFQRDRGRGQACSTFNIPSPKNRSRAVPVQRRLEQCGRTSEGGPPGPVDGARQIDESACRALPEYAQRAGHGETSLSGNKPSSLFVDDDDVGLDRLGQKYGCAPPVWSRSVPGEATSGICST